MNTQEEIKIKCSSCEESFTEDEIKYGENRHGDNLAFCEACSDDELYMCQDCNEIYTYEDYNYDGNTICNSCFIDNYSICNDCNVLYNSDNGYYCENCDENLCESCNSEHSHNEPEYRNLNIELLPEEKNSTGDTIKINRLVGLELEACNGDDLSILNNLPDKCGITSDGSLCGSSAEIQTPPRKTKRLEQMIKKTCSVMKDAGMDTSDGCSGLHVHIDFNDHRYNIESISKVFRTFYAIEDIIYAYLRNDRSTRSYCVPLHKKYNINDIKVKMSEKELLQKYYKISDDGIKDLEAVKTRLKSDHGGLGNRYHGLNLHSIFYRGTIEFRYHEGCIDSKEIIQWVNFLLHAVEYAVNNYNTDDIRSLYKMKTKYRKVLAMCKFMNIPRELQKHIFAKIRKEHPAFLKTKKKIISKEYAPLQEYLAQRAYITGRIL